MPTNREEILVERRRKIIRVVRGHDRRLMRLENKVCRDVQRRLDARPAGGRDANVDDKVFWLFNRYCEACLRAERLVLLPAELWSQRLADIVAKSEKDIGQANAVHKGAPLFNVSLCLFRGGLLDRAVQFLATAADEERLSGRPGIDLITGNHPLAPQILIQPIIDVIENSSSPWAGDYCDVTGESLDEAELKELLKWLTFGQPEISHTLQLIVALHRFIGIQTKSDNDAAKHLRLQALTDLILIIESSLRTWDTTGSEQLHKRMENCLDGTRLDAFFQTAHGSFLGQYPARDDRETTVAANWAIDDALNGISGASDTATRAGIVAYLAVRLRNSLMHVIDEGFGLYADQAKCEKVFGLMLAAIRLSMHGNKGTLSRL